MFTFYILTKVDTLLYQVHKRLYNLWEISYKLLIKVYEFEKCLYIINVLWVFSADNCFDFHRVHFNIIIENNQI